MHRTGPPLEVSDRGLNEAIPGDDSLRSPFLPGTS